MRMSLSVNKALVAATASGLALLLPAPAIAQASNTFSSSDSSSISASESIAGQEKCDDGNAWTGGGSNDQQSKIEEAQKEYETFNLEEAIEGDPQRYSQNLSIIENSAALVEYFDRYSGFPEEDKARMAASTPTVVVSDIASNLEGKSLLIHPTTGEVEVVPANESEKYNNYPSFRNSPCWKSYVGAGTAAVVGGFFCGLGGPITATACTVGLAVGGTHVDWNRHC